MRFYSIFLILLCTLIPQLSNSQGLKFSGNEQPIDKRTSYNVFSHASVSFSEYFDIDFSLSLDASARMGHIVRIKNDKSDKIYNLFYDGQGDHYVFRFNEEGRSSLVVAEIDKHLLSETNWIKVKVALDLINDSIGLTIQNHVFSANDIGLPDKYHPELIFGKSDYIIDVPSFAIRNLSIGNNKKRYIFPLRESEGDIVHDDKGNIIGDVSNPEWLINDSYKWKLIASADSKTQAGSAYNEAKKEVYYFNQDSIFVYNVKTDESRTIVFRERCPVDLILATNFIDTKRERLYVYEVYYNRPYNGATVASLDLNSFEWTIESYDNLNHELHHHGSFFNPAEEAFTIFGGFGANLYSKEFYSYDLDSSKWNLLDSLRGDVIFPRYFLSVGFNEKENAAYIFGGMGNESGEHIVGRKYLYDLYKVDFDTKHTTKLWETSWVGDNVVPARHIVLDGDSCFYALCYPEHVSKSFLKLYQFSLKDGEHKHLGDSIPIYSDKITTRAQLYYDEQLTSLFAVVQESIDDISSSIKVYSLAFPPIAEDELGNYPKAASDRKYFIIFSVLLMGFVVIGYFIYQRSRSRQSINRKLVRESLKGARKNVSRANAIYLFGDFTVLDRHNKDITHLFSTRLKQTLCLILEHSIGDGISSQRLSNLLWPERSEDKVKNLRGVTINHLRKALSELDGVELIHEKGNFKIVQTDQFYCDYIRCIQIISGKLDDNKNELVNILNRGKFLKFSDHSLFDYIKTAIERNLEPILLNEIEKSYRSETHQTTIDLAEAIFNIDPLNDNALAYEIKTLVKLKLEDEARLKYQAFTFEYRKSMGSDYPYSFQDLV